MPSNTGKLRCSLRKGPKQSRSIIALLSRHCLATPWTDLTSTRSDVFYSCRTLLPARSATQLRHLCCFIICFRNCLFPSAIPLVCCARRQSHVSMQFCLSCFCVLHRNCNACNIMSIYKFVRFCRLTFSFRAGFFWLGMVIVEQSS